MAQTDSVLEKDFKKIAEVLGEKWKYTYHDSELPHVDDYMDSENISFNLNGEEMLLSFHHSDPDTLWIYSGLFQVSFGPVNHIHFEDSKVVVESILDQSVDFIELSDDGKCSIYHNFDKNTYRSSLHQKLKEF